MKNGALLSLARQRQSSRFNGYAAVGDFHDGIYECDHVSPWTKSGSNVDAEVMVVGQDWSSSDSLGATSPDLNSVMYGFSPKFPTNANLDALLKRHLRLARADCYLTNLFPYIKYGGPSANIPFKDLVACAKRFTLPEIEIVAPELVICLGLRTFTALMRATGIKGSPKMDEAVKNPFKHGCSMIFCVAHTGALGMNNRGRQQVEVDWQEIAKCRAERAPNIHFEQVTSSCAKASQHLHQKRGTG